MHIDAIWAPSGETYSNHHQFLILFRDGAICQGGFIESLKARHCFRYRLAKGRQLLQIFDVVHIRPQQVLRYLANYTHRVALSNRRMVAIDAQHQTVTFTYRDYRHGSQRKQLTLSALELLRRFSLHILPPGLVRIRHYGILGNNRRKRDIEAARAICKSSGCALELQPRSVADPSCGAMCCPSCGKAGIRLVAFTDAAGVLHMIGAWPTPCDSS